MVVMIEIFIYINYTIHHIQKWFFSQINDTLKLMKIVFDGLIYSLQNQGGISRYFDELINGLAERPDHEVIVLMRKNNSNKIFNDKVKIEIIDSTIYTNNKFFKYLSVFIDGIKTQKFLHNRKNLQNGILHHTYYRHFSNIGSKQVITVYDMTDEIFPKFFKGLFYYLYAYNKKRAILKADSIITISESIKKDIINIYGIAPEKIDVIYLGVSKIFKKVAENKPTKPFFLYVGYRYYYKNFPLLLKAFSSWSKKDDYSLLCLGGGEFKKDETRLIENLNLNNIVKQIPNITDTDLVSYYNDTTALIYPSLYEGFGLPIIEAMACDTPVICSDIPVFHEVGGASPLFFTNSQTDLMRCLDEVTNNTYSSPTNSRGWTETFTWEKTTLNTLEIYKKYYQS